MQHACSCDFPSVDHDDIHVDSTLCVCEDERSVLAEAVLYGASRLKQQLGGLLEKMSGERHIKTHSIHRLRISKGSKPSSEFDCPLVECRLRVGPLRERIHVAVHPVFGGPRSTGIEIGGVLESDFSISTFRDDLSRG